MIALIFPVFMYVSKGAQSVSVRREAEAKAGTFLRADWFCTRSLGRERVAYCAIINYARMLVSGQMVIWL